MNGAGVKDCFLGGEGLAYHDRLDASNTLANSKTLGPEFDDTYTPQNAKLDGVGYRPFEPPKN